MIDLDIGRILALADAAEGWKWAPGDADDLRALVAQRRAVLDLHYESVPNAFGMTFCGCCSYTYPCQTAQALGVQS